MAYRLKGFIMLVRSRRYIFCTILVILISVVANYSYACQWPVAKFLSKGSVDKETGLLKGAEGDSTKLSSDFGPRKVPSSPMHSGIDIPVVDGTPVYSTVTGTVSKKGWCTNGGYRIVIKDSDGRLHSYMHLIDDKDWKNKVDYPPQVKKKDKVQEGQQIGWSDSTVKKRKNGDVKYGSTHLDYKVYTEKDGERLYVNPLHVLPYRNKEIPRVAILTPEDGTHVGKEEQDREVVIKTNVEAEEKDLSRLILRIEGKEAPGAEFNFEEKGRKKVAIDIEGEKYIYNKKKNKWLEAGKKEAEQLGSYVKAGYVDSTEGSDDTFSGGLECVR